MKDYHRVTPLTWDDTAAGFTHQESLGTFSNNKNPTSWTPHSYSKLTIRCGIMSLPSPIRGRDVVTASWESLNFNYSREVTSSERAAFMTHHRNAIGDKATNILDIIRTRYETANMITSNVKKLYKSMSLLRKGKWKRAASALGVSPKGAPKGRDVPARWLELQYGWLPLLGDVYALGNKMFRVPTFQVRSTRWYNDQKVLRERAPGWKSTILADSSTRATFVTQFTINSAAVTTLDNLGVLNPTLVAWEAVPFSFIVDWFLPVGDFLASLTALAGITVTNHCFTIKTKTTFSGTKTVYGRTGGIAAEHIQKSRSVTPMSITLPRFKNPFSLTHFANAFSLLAVAFKK